MASPKDWEYAQKKDLPDAGLELPLLTPNERYWANKKDIPDASPAPFVERRKEIRYKYNEPAVLAELEKYIDGTYGEHYSQARIQTTEFVIDAGHGVGFTVGNIMKYAQRYGKKDGYNRKDILKVIHYAIMLLHVHDTQHTSPIETGTE